MCLPWPGPPPAPPLFQCGTDRGLMDRSLEPERNTPQRLDGERAPPRWLNRSSVGEGGADLLQLLGNVSGHYEAAAV